MGSISRAAVADRMISNEEFRQAICEHGLSKELMQALIDLPEGTIEMNWANHGAISVEQGDGGSDTYIELAVYYKLVPELDRHYRVVLDSFYFDEDGAASELCRRIGINPKVAYPDDYDDDGNPI